MESLCYTCIGLTSSVMMCLLLSWATSASSAQVNGMTDITCSSSTEECQFVNQSRMWVLFYCIQCGALRNWSGWSLLGTCTVCSQWHFLQSLPMQEFLLSSTSTLMPHGNIDLNVSLKDACQCLGLSARKKHTENLITFFVFVVSQLLQHKNKTFPVTLSLFSLTVQKMVSFQDPSTRSLAIAPNLEFWSSYIYSTVLLLLIIIRATASTSTTPMIVMIMVSPYSSWTMIKIHHALNKREFKTAHPLLPKLVAHTEKNGGKWYNCSVNLKRLSLAQLWQWPQQQW